MPLGRRERCTYSHAPPQVFRDLLAAPSKGAFFNHSIKGYYAYAKAAG